MDFVVKEKKKETSGEKKYPKIKKYKKIKKNKRVVLDLKLKDDFDSQIYHYTLPYI